MYRVINFNLLFKYTAYLTVILSMAVYYLVTWLWLPKLALYQVVGISSLISTLIIFILSTNFFSRKIWALCTYFKKDLFPDLNGTWHGKITTENEDEIKVRAVIRHSLLLTQIDMHGETMKSITLETTPIIEAGQRKLYYLFRSTPKNPSWHSYNGCTLFDLREIENGKEKVLEMTGHYYTDRKSVGRISIQQTSIDPHTDVSFY